MRTTINVGRNWSDENYHQP